jgi:hypothetical protein
MPWFGKGRPWNRLIDNTEHVATPVGQLCLYCDEAIVEGDEGQMVFSFDGAKPVHRECLVRQVVGSIGHQLKRCSCYGGNEEDPPGMTRRQAAIAACKYFEDI